MTGIDRAVRKALCKLLLDQRISTAQRLDTLKLANEWARLRPGRPPVTSMDDARQSQPGIRETKHREIQGSDCRHRDRVARHCVGLSVRNRTHRVKGCAADQPLDGAEIR